MRLYVLLAAMLSFAPAIALAQESASPRQAASAHFRHGVSLFEEGDNEGALVEFERAYEAHPTYQVLYNIGQTALGLRRYVRALEALERYLAEGGASIGAERRADVDRMVETLRSRTAHVEVAVDVEGAQIRIDDRDVGISPLTAPLVIDVGRHRLRVRAEGYEDHEEDLAVAGDDRASVVVTLERRRVDAAGAPEVDHTFQALGIAGLIGTAAAAGVAIAGLVLGLDARASLDSMLTMIPANVPAIEDARSDAFTYGLLADVMTGTAVVLGGLSIVFLVLDASAGAPQDTRRARIEAAPGGLRLRF